MFYPIFARLFAILSIAFFINPEALAQYKGGKGDGFDYANAVASVDETGAVSRPEEIEYGRSQAVLYPNPARAGQTVFLSFERPIDAPVHITAFNAMGQTVLQYEAPAVQTGSLPFLAELPAGWYAIVVKLNGKNFRIKWVKQ